MNFEKYTERARGFVQAAQNLAMREGHPQLQPGHLLKVLLDDPEGLCAGLIDRAGGQSRVALAQVEAWLAKQPKVSGNASQPQATRDLMRLFDTAEKAAEKAGDSYVTVERLLLALAVEKDTEAGKALVSAGVTPASLNGAINALRKGRTADNASAENAYDALKKYARDLTEAAREGKLDPVIGRDEEIRRTIQHPLAAKQKTTRCSSASPASARPPSSRASRSASCDGDVPEGLKDKTIFSPSIWVRSSPARSIRGEFEERLKAVLNEVKAGRRPHHYFHRRAPYDRRRRQEPRARWTPRNLLKPACSRAASLHCIGATTLDEYRKHIEKDAALERRFQPVVVDRSRVSRTRCRFCAASRRSFELHHGVRIQDSTRW